MSRFPEPSLLPPESPSPTLRCCLCHEPVAEALELLYGPVCRRCLCRHVSGSSMDTLSALLCAPVLTNDF